MFPKSCKCKELSAPDFHHEKVAVFVTPLSPTSGLCQFLQFLKKQYLEEEKSAVFTRIIASVLSKSISIGLLRAWSQTGKRPVTVSMLGEGPEKDWEEQCRPLFPWPGLTPLSLLHEDTGPID